MPPDDPDQRVGEVMGVLGALMALGRMLWSWRRSPALADKDEGEVTHGDILNEIRNMRETLANQSTDLDAIRISLQDARETLARFDGRLTVHAQQDDAMRMDINDIRDEIRQMRWGRGRG